MRLYLVMVFLSGFAGLVYEVLWMKQLGLLFGNTSHAAAATLSAFFGGMAVGSAFWGRRSARSSAPLRMFAGLELGIAVSALLYFGVLSVYHSVYPALYDSVSAAPLLLTIKFALAGLLVFPPSFFMGGTLPVMGQFLVDGAAPDHRPVHHRLGSTAALLYGCNTVGAALGACLAGFYLPLWLGFKLTCVGAILISLAVASMAYWLAGQPGDPEAAARPATRGGDPRSVAGVEATSRHWTLSVVCFLSGFGVLALEVLWTRMFAQVLENSTYTFSAILVTVLLCLAVGAFVSSLLARTGWSPVYVLSVLLLASGIAVAATPFVFMRLTDSMQIVATRSSWSHYVLLIFRKSLLAVGPPALLLGTVFPYLMKTEEQYAASAGQTLGRLSAINTVGAILGSLVCGFVLLETLGMWGAMQSIAIVYLVGALLVPVGFGAAGMTMRGLGVIGLLVAMAGLNPSRLPVSSVDPQRHREQILETWEASGCTVAAVRDPYGISIKINSHYGLGSTGAMVQQRLQAAIPLMVRPHTERIFFLGMGTGITAGSALDPQFPHVKRVVACELVPEVITAARKYIANDDGYDHTGGLFSDPRVTILAEDGRHYLLATQEKFDMINADLFVPFRSGVGSLYSREHFETAKSKLAPDGVFVQWLPLYQLTEKEFKIIARTMIEVFEGVTMWRSTFQPGEEVVALVGHQGARPVPGVDGNSLEARIQALQGKTHRDLANLALPFDPESILFFYCGNLKAASDLFADAPVNTDDKPYVEYLAPRNYRRASGVQTPWFVGPRLARLVDDLFERCPLEEDPMLDNRAADRTLPAAGAAYHWSRIYGVIGDDEQCRRTWNKFVLEYTAARNQKEDSE